MSSPRPCQAENPATCRYHGTLENHTEAHKKLTVKYTNMLRDMLTGKTKTSAHKVDAIREQLKLTQASVDSHDTNFLALLNERDLLARKGLDRYLNSDEEKDLEDLNERVFNAQMVRFKRDVSETNHLNDGRIKDTSTVRTLPVGVEIASGEKVVSVRPVRGLHASKGKMEVILERKDGTRKTAYWNASTKIGYLQSPPSAVETSEPDPWAPLPVP